MSQNNQNSDAAAAVGFIVAGLMIMAFIIFALLAFVAFILTVLCMVAWNKPLTIGKQTLYPEEARRFVRRGLFGALLLPFFCAFAELLFNVGINWDALPHMMVAGYIGGSLGMEWLLAQEEEMQAAPPQPQLPAVQEVQPPHKALPPCREPFEFASWDDEEEGR